MKKSKKDHLFTHRIEFYQFLEKYRKAGNNVIQLQAAIKDRTLKKLPFDLDHKVALIIVNDYIANNKTKKLSSSQLQLFPLI